MFELSCCMRFRAQHAMNCWR